jgi:hypothetical protein
MEPPVLLVLPELLQLLQLLQLVQLSELLLSGTGRATNRPIIILMMMLHRRNDKRREPMSASDIFVTKVGPLLSIN